MRGKLEQPHLWESTKYVSWPRSHTFPVVRIPTPAGQPESKTIKGLPGEQERDTFNRCIAYRDKRGPEIWGKRRWDELVSVQKRSVAKHRHERRGPMTGVNHYERHDRSVWIATWYEPLPDGSRRKRSKWFSYGTSKSQFATSGQAEAAAIECREREEARWYSTSGIGKQRHASRLEDVDR